MTAKTEMQQIEIKTIKEGNAGFDLEIAQFTFRASPDTGGRVAGKNHIAKKNCREGAFIPMCYPLSDRSCRSIGTAGL